MEGGKAANALARLNELLTSAGIRPSSVTASIWPNQAIYGTTIHVELSCPYEVKSSVFRTLAGATIPVPAKVVTRSESCRDRDTRRRLFLHLLRDSRGGVAVLVALFLPVAVLCVGTVVDLGAVFFARKAVEASCDLGALPGVQELDWDRLAAGRWR